MTLSHHAAVSRQENFFIRVPLTVSLIRSIRFAQVEPSFGALASTRRLNKRRETETDAISITQEEIMNAVGIKVKKDSNHTSRINYLRSIPLMDDAFVHIDIREDVDVETAASYINTLDLSKVEHIFISVIIK